MDFSIQRSEDSFEYTKPFDEIHSAVERAQAWTVLGPVIASPVGAIGACAEFVACAVLLPFAFLGTAVSGHTQSPAATALSCGLMEGAERLGKAIANTASWGLYAKSEQNQRGALEKVNEVLVDFERIPVLGLLPSVLKAVVSVVELVVASIFTFIATPFVALLFKEDSKPAKLLNMGIGSILEGMHELAYSIANIITLTAFATSFYEN